MPDSERGEYTFLFTDIEGSTRMWEREPDRMWPELSHHDALLTEILTRHGGQVFKTVGDAFCSVFTSPAAAVSAAVAAQRALFTELPRLRVRMAVHTGHAHRHGDDYFGPALNRVARLLAAGHGGQVLISSTVARELKKPLPDGADLRGLGVHRLRDIEATEEIFQVRPPDLPDRFPPLNTYSEAYRRGRLRTLKWTSAVIVIISLFAASAVREWRRAEAAGERSERARYASNMTLLQREWDRNDLRRVREILAETASSRYRQFEWGYWQRRVDAGRLLDIPAGTISHLAYSPDGARLITAGLDGARVWDAASGREVARGPAEGPSFAAEFSPDGRLAVSASLGANGSHVVVWDTLSSKPNAAADFEADSIDQVAFAPDGKSILVAGTAESSSDNWRPVAYRWTIDTDTRVTYDGALAPVELSADGRTLWSSADWNHGDSIRGAFPAASWDAATGRRLAPCKLNCLAYSKGAAKAVVELPRGQAAITSPGGGQPVVVLDGALDRLDAGIGVSHDGTRAYTLPDPATTRVPMRVWDVRTGRELFRLPGAFFCATISPDGKRIATATNEGVMRVWNGEEPAPFASIPLESSTPAPVACSATGRIAAGEGAGVLLWTGQRGSPVRLIPSDEGISAAGFSADGALVAGGSARGRLTVWGAASGDKQWSLALRARVRVLSFSPNRATVAACTTGQKGVRLFSVGSGHELRPIDVDALVTDVAWSPRGDQLVLGAADGTVQLFEAASARRSALLRSGAPGALSVAWSPDGRQIAAGGEDTVIRIWNAENKLLVHTLRGHRHWIRRVAYSPDGRRLASSDAGGEIRLWDTESGREMLETHAREGTFDVRGLAWATNNRLAVAAGSRLVLLTGDPAGSPPAGGEEPRP